MKRIISGITAAAIAATIAVTFSSCGKKGDVIASKEHVYSTEKITLPKGLDYIDRVLYSNEKLYFIGNHSWSEKVDPPDTSGEDDTLPAGSVEVAVTAAVAFAEAPDEVKSASAETVSVETEAAEPAETEPASDENADTADTGDTSDAIIDVPAEEPAYEEWYTETLLQIVDLDGTLEKEVVLVSADDRKESGSSRYMTGVTADKDGGLASIYQEYKWDPETGDSDTQYFLVIYSEDGDIVTDVSLKALVDDNSQDYFYINSIISVGGGQYLTMTDNTMYLIDRSGAIVKKMVNENLQDNAWMSGIYETGDGRFVVQVYRSYEDNGEWKSDNKLIEIDIENQQFGTEYDYDLNGSLMNGTEVYDLLITRDSGLAGYDIETGYTEVIIDWIKSGIDTSTLQTSTTTVLKDGRILCMTYDYTYLGGGSYSWGGGDSLVLSILTEIPPETLPDKKLIKLYSMYLDMDVKRHVLEFNKNSLEYEVELTSYYDYGDQGITQMNNDMIAGNLPDIIILNSALPVDSYIAKGLFADIYEFMENDPDINRSDYLENIFKAYEVNGKLYEIVPTFNVSTLVGKSSVVGDTPGWTMDEFISFVDANPDKIAFPDYSTKSDVLNSFIYYCYSSYINKETGECYFDGDNFIKLLEFCNRFVTKLPDDFWDHYYDDYDWRAEETELRTGKRLFETTSFSQFSRIREIEQGTFGEPITFKGYPGASGSGSAINAYTTMAITSKAKNAEGAWEFMKYFYSDEYQDQYTTRNSYSFPIKMSSLEKLAESAKERPYWEDEDGNKEYYDNTYWIGDERIDIGVNTDEDNQKVMDFLKSVDNVYRYDTNITKIISEETGPYFEGQKSAKEVAGIIQNRVSNYIAESR